MNSKKPILSISLLSSGRKNTLKKCLDSLTPLREAIDSELILVDTGCNEEIKKLMQEYTDIIIPFTWCNDFSKARNAGLQKAKGEWFLYIDDDEWFTDVEELIQFFTTDEYKEYVVGNYYQRNYKNFEGTVWSDTWVTRVIRRDKDTCFKSSIHEYLHPMKPGVTKLFKNTFAEHYGYIYATKEEFNEHSKRNVTLLLDILKREKKEIRWWVQLAQEYIGLAEYYRLADFCKEGIDYFEKDTRVNTRNGRGGLYVAWLRACNQIDSCKEVISAFERGMNDKRITDFAKAAMCAEAVNSYYKVGDYEKCMEVCQQYFEYQQKMAENEEMKFSQGTLFVEDAFSEQKIQQVYEIYIKCGLKKEDITPLITHFSKLKESNSKKLKIGRELIENIVDIMATCPYGKELVTIAGELADCENSKDVFWKKISAYVLERKMQEKETLRIAKIIADIESQHLSYWYMKIVYAEAMNETELLEQYFVKLASCAFDLFEMQDDLFELAKKRKINIKKLIMEIPMNRFQFSVERFCKEADLNRIDNRINAIWENAEDAKDIRLRYFFVKRWEKAVCTQAENCEYEQLQKMMEEFAVNCINYYKIYFKDCAFEEDLGVLPSICCAALKIQKILEEERNNRFRKSGELLIELAKEYSAFASVSNKYAQLSAERAKKIVQEEKETFTQMEILAAQIKGKMKELIAVGELEAAHMIFMQLKTLRPNDPELEELEKTLLGSC